MKQTEKQIFGVKKSKAYGLCGVALATFSMMVATPAFAFADEVASQPVVETVAQVESLSEDEKSFLAEVDAFKNDPHYDEFSVVETIGEKKLVEVHEEAHGNSYLSDGYDVNEAKPHSEELLNIVKELKNEGVRVVDERDGAQIPYSETVVNQAEYDDFIKRATELEAKEVEDLKTLLEKVKADKAQYAEDVKAYEELLVKYEDALKNAELNKNKQGHLSEVVGQKLIFERERDTEMNITGGTVLTTDEVKAFMQSIGKNDRYATNYSASISRADTPAVKVSEGESVTVLYTGLDNSYLNNVKIAAKAYKYTIIDSGTDTGETVIGLINDPTATLRYMDYGNSASIKVEEIYYNQDGNVINPAGAIISFSSLNSKADGSSYESVKDFSGRFISINGSSVTVQDGEARAWTGNESVAEGAKFDRTDWDSNKSANAFYGSIAGLVTGDTISYVVSSAGRNYVWFASNSSINATDVPVEPVKPADLDLVITSFKTYFVNKQGNVDVSVVTEDGEQLDGVVTKPIFVGNKFTTLETKRKISDVFEFDGKLYRLIEIQGDEVSDIELGTKKITYVVRLQKTTEWVDTEDAVLKDKITGDQVGVPGGFDDYEFVDEVPTEHGVKYIFKKKEIVNVPEVSIPVTPSPAPAPVSVPSVSSPAPTLPNTGDGFSLLTVVGGALSSVLGLVGLGRKKED